MAVSTPENATQVEDRIKVDVQREAPDSNPYLRVHWLRSLIAGIARRIFDFYQDLTRTESRLMPDTADEEFSLRWGNIYVGPPNAASGANGSIAITGTAGGTVGIGETYISGVSEYTTTSIGTITAQSLSVDTITRSGSTATVTTVDDHNLSSSVPVSISLSSESEYNTADNDIVVTGLNAFTYQVSGTPIDDLGGTALAAFTAGVVDIDSVDFGADTNLDLDTPLTLQSPIVNVDDTANVTFGTIGGGSDVETTDDYKIRYLEKIRDPVANFNPADIISKAKEVAGVTRVFVEPAGTNIGPISIRDSPNGINSIDNVVTVETDDPHGFDDGSTVTIRDATVAAYNVTEAYIIVETTTIFHFVALGGPHSSPDGSSISNVSLTVPLGQVRTFFMRDNDDDPIPSAPEVAVVKAKIDEILPANTYTGDSIVSGPTGITQDYFFIELVPNTLTMQAAVDASLAQFHAEQTVVSTDVDAKAYEAAITNTVDPETNETVTSFTLTDPPAATDISIDSGEISLFGTATYPAIP